MIVLAWWCYLNFACRSSYTRREDSEIRTRDLTTPHDVLRLRLQELGPSDEHDWPVMLAGNPTSCFLMICLNPVIAFQVLFLHAPGWSQGGGVRLEISITGDTGHPPLKICLLS